MLLDKIQKMEIRNEQLLSNNTGGRRKVLGKVPGNV